MIHMDFLGPYPHKGECPRINIDFASFVLRCFQTTVVSRLSTHPFKYAFFDKKFKVQDLLVEHVITDL
jgi:hypothetical protein